MSVHYIPRWDQKADARLAALLDGRRSAAVIARALGVVSRNSVISRVRRLRDAGALPPGKTLRPSLKAPATGKRRLKRPRVSNRLTMERRLQALKAQWRDRPPEHHASIAMGKERFAEGYFGQTGRLAIQDLRLDTCRFPIDQPHGPPRYCGLEAEKGGSWCPHHAARVFKMKVEDVVHGPDQ